MTPLIGTHEILFRKAYTFNARYITCVRFKEY